MSPDKFKEVFERVCFIREEEARQSLSEALREIGQLRARLNRPAHDPAKSSQVVKSVRQECRTLRAENAALRAELKREKRKTHFACPQCSTHARRQGASLESVDTSQAGGIPDGLTFINANGDTVTTAGYQFVSAKNEGFSRAAHRVESH